MALPGSVHCESGVGGTRPKGRPLRGVEEGKRPCLGALPAGSGEEGSTPGAASLLKEGHLLAGRLEPEERGTGPGRGDSVSLVSSLVPPSGSLVSELLPAASHPRPLLPSCRCRFLWLRLSLSHELTTPNGLQLPRCSSSRSPFPASEQTAHSA